MSDFLGRFSRSRPHGFPERASAIKTWIRAVLSLGDEVVVSVNELACGQPDCPPLQTVILVLAPSRPARKLTIHKSLLEVEEADVMEAARTNASVIAGFAHGR